MTAGRPRRSASIVGTTPIVPSVEAMPVTTRSTAASLPIFLIASASTSEVATASEPWMAASFTCTPLWAPICRAFLMASAAWSGPTVRTVTSPSPASTILRASSIAYSSSSDSRPSTFSRSVVLSDALNVRSAWASGTYLTQTTMFMGERPLPLLVVALMEQPEVAPALPAILSLSARLVRTPQA